MTKKPYLTPDQIRRSCQVMIPGDEREQEMCAINGELEQGFSILEKATNGKKSVTFYGSARTQEGDPLYEAARALAYRLTNELGVTVVTGGGPGIMEAANRGAVEADGDSIGLTIKLPNEQATNKFVLQEIPFDFFFTRKVLLFFSAEAYIFFPGGYGTFDEFFELVTLIQTEKIPRMPIILFGKEFWSRLDNLIKEEMVEKYKTLSDEERSLYTITDDPNEVVRIVKETDQRSHEGK